MTCVNQKETALRGETEATLALCRAVIKLVCKWISLFPNYLQYHLESTQNQNLYLVSLNHAIASSLPELAEMLKLCFGFVKRCGEKFRLLSKELFERTPYTASGFLSNEILLQKENIHTFYEEKGLELVIDIVAKTDHRCPISVILDLLDPLVKALCVVKNESAYQSFSVIFKEITERFSALNDRDIKEISKATIQELLGTFETIVSPRNAVNLPKDTFGITREFIEKMLFSIAMQLINTPYIQKKLLGIGMIREMMPIQKRITQPSTTSEWKNPLQLIKVMEDNKLLEILLGENAHAEILRKVEDIFLFYLSCKKLEKKHIELLWKCANEKYEDVMRACLDLLANLVSKMDISLIQELFKYIEAADCQSEILINFFERYTLIVLKLLDSKEALLKKVDIPKGKLINLDLFWKLILDQRLPGKLKDQAMKALVRILKSYASMLSDYVYKAAELISDEKMTSRGIQFLQDVDLATYYIESQGVKRDAFNLEEMNAKYSLIKSILKDCEAYHLKVKSEIEASTDKKKNIMETDFGTGLTFNNQTNLYISFLLYLCSKSTLSLTKEEFLKLWKCYVEEALCEEHADILFRAMLAESQLPLSKFKLFNDKVARAVFDEILCGSEARLTQLTSCGFSCFRKYMIWVNQREIVNSQISGLEGYQGFQMLWKIVFQGKGEQLREQAKEFLVNFIDSMCQKNKSKRKEFTETALKFALDNVKSVEDIERTKTALSIINSIIEKIELTKYEEIGPEYLYPPLISLQVIYSPKEKPLTVKLNDNMKLSNLKCYLSNKFKIHKSKIILKTSLRGQQYGDNKDYFLNAFKRTSDGKIIVEFKGNDFPDNETPRYVLANSVIFTRLKNLLSSPKEEVVDEVWNLMTNLPLNNNANEKLTKLAFPKKTNDIVKAWQEYLGVTPEYDSVILVYYLYILNGKMAEKTKNERYVDYFLNNNGNVFILSIFKKKLSESHTILNLKSLEYCIRIISNYILQEYIKIFAEDASDEFFWNGVKQLIKWVSDKKTESTIDLSDVFEACCQANYLMLKANFSFIESATSEDYINALKNSLLLNKNKDVQTNTQKLLEKIFLEILKSTETKEKQKNLMNVLLTDFLNTALSNCENPEPYFCLVTELIEESVELEYEVLVKQRHVPFLTEQITNKPATEKGNKGIDYSLGGVMDMLRLEIIKHPHLRSQLKSVSELSQGILEALFNIEEEGVKCKNERTRGKALKLLETLTSYYPESGAIARTYLHSLHINGNWRTNKKSEWNIMPGLGTRRGSFVGMKNLGATCYMNSSLQQFFMLPQFRKGILEVDHTKKGEDTSVLYQLQLIFSFLLKSQRAVYNPKAFTQSVKIDGQTLSAAEQKDVDEFIMYFLDQLEQELKGTSQERLIKETFTLTLANEIICKDCPHRSEATEDAISVIVSVKNKKTLYEGLKAYIEADTLEGDNAYYCERCDKKVAANKRQSIKTLHNVLIIVLKRFEFNVETMTRVKVNDFCEFPHELDLEEFTQEGQTCKELNRDIETNKISFDDLTEDQKKLLQRKIPKYYYKYKLTGIIVHTGNVDAGHYYSYILNRDNPEADEWLEFNDTIVRKFDPKKIPEEAFGGEEEIYAGYGKKEMFREKIRNAYVLIYERIVPLNPEALDKYKKEERDVDPKDVEKRFEAMKIKHENGIIKIPKFLQSIVNEDNTKFWMTQYIFHPDYLSFVSSMINKPNSVETDKLKDVDVAQFITVFLLTVALRAKNQEKVPNVLSFIKNHCERNIRHCQWISSLFSYPQISQEFLINCPHELARRWVAELLKCIMTRIYVLEKREILNIGQKSETITSSKELCKMFKLPPNTATSPNKISITEVKVPYLWLLMDSLMQQIQSISEISIEEFFQVFCCFANLGSEARRFLNRCQMFGVAFESLGFAKRPCRSFLVNSVVHLEFKGSPPLKPISQKLPRYHKKQLRRADTHTFIFELMYKLILNTEITRSKKSELKNEEFAVKLSNTENMYIADLKNPKTINDLLGICAGNKAALTFFGKMMAYIAFDNEEYIKIILQFVLGRIQNSNIAELRAIFRVVYFLQENQDTYPSKFSAFLDHFCDCFNNCKNNPRTSEMLIDFLIKLCRNNNILLLTLRKMKNTERYICVDLMENWLNPSPYTSFNFSGRILNATTKSSTRITEDLEKRYRSLTESRRTALKTIKKDSAKLDAEENSDDDMYTLNMKFKKGEKLGKCQWVTATAMVASDEVVKVEFVDQEENCEEWVTIDSDRIMPSGSMVKNIRWQLTAELDSV